MPMTLHDVHIEKDVTTDNAMEKTYTALNKYTPETVGGQVYGRNILIKPNLVYDTTDKGVVTDVNVIEGIVKYFSERNNKITIAEGSAIDDTKELFDKFGYVKLAEKYDVELVDLNDGPFTKTEVYDMKLDIAKPIIDSDYVISVPVLKTHEYTAISASVKNLMGCLKRGKATKDAPKESIHKELTALQKMAESELKEGEERIFLPKDNMLDYFIAAKKFQKRLLTLNNIIYPQLSVVDAIIAGEGNGPIYSTPIELGMLIIGEKSVPVDATCARLMGIQPQDVGYLKLAESSAMGGIYDIVTNEYPKRISKRFKFPELIEYIWKSDYKELI